jgi:hypothetical protein
MLHQEGIARAPKGLGDLLQCVERDVPFPALDGPTDMRVLPGTTPSVPEGGER